MVQKPLVGQGLLIIKVSPSHVDKPHSLGLLWTSDQPVTHIYLYLTKHNTPKRQTSMPAAGFEAAFPTSERPYTDALDRADIRTVYETFSDISFGSNNTCINSEGE